MDSSIGMDAVFREGSLLLIAGQLALPQAGSTERARTHVQDERPHVQSPQLLEVVCFNLPDSLALKYSTPVSYRSPGNMRIRIK